MSQLFNTGRSIVTVCLRANDRLIDLIFAVQDVQRIEFLEPEWELEAVDMQTKCGLFFYRPKWLQRFASKGLSLLLQYIP